MASSDYILKIESVRGETKRANSEDESIQVMTFELGMSSSHFEGPGPKHRRYTNLRFTKLLDRSSTALQQMLATNSKIRQATLTVRKAGGEQIIYYTIILKDAFIVSYKIRGEELPDEFRSLPRDEFEISFSKIEIEYSDQTQKGFKGSTSTFRDDIRSNE
jgi:type VI secretion system secreted protein Hcp